MSKSFLLAFAAGVALLMAGCTKPGNDNGNGNGNGGGNGNNNGNEAAKITAADFVGSWGQGTETDILVLKEGGTYTEKGWDETVSGKWSFNESAGTITMTPNGGEALTRKVLLIGGKAWLVFIEEMDNEGFKSRVTDSYRKAGATVKSAPLGDGRWDAPHNGVKPAKYDEEADYRICLVVAGNKIDLYVPMWGYHIQGTFTLDNGRIKITTDDDHIWAGKTISKQDSYHYYFGWNVWNDDLNCLSMNPETFELRGYTWYSVNDLKRMGHAPSDANDISFEAAIWGAAEQLHEEAMELCDFELCVTDDGKEAYGGAIGLTPWFYKR